MTEFLACSKCDETVIKGMNSGEVKIRAKVLVIRGIDTYAICKGCGSELKIPLSFDEDVAKSIYSKKEPRLYLKSY